MAVAPQAETLLIGSKIGEPYPIQPVPNTDVRVGAVAEVSDEHAELPGPAHAVAVPPHVIDTGGDGRGGSHALLARLARLTAGKSRSSDHSPELKP